LRFDFTAFLAEVFTGLTACAPLADEATVVLALDDSVLLDQRAKCPALYRAVGRTDGLQGQLALRANGHGAISTQRVARLYHLGQSR
jgi:hypothetical protein